MRIACVSPLMEAVPPKLYGGTERVVAYLCDELAALGHEVTLFASGDSVTRARLVPVWPCALRLDPGMRDYLAPHIVMVEVVGDDARGLCSAPPARSMGPLCWHPATRAPKGVSRADREGAAGAD